MRIFVLSTVLLSLFGSGLASPSEFLSKVWTVSCRNYRCEHAFVYCVQTKCNSDLNCRDCIKAHYPDCQTCLDEFFQPDQFLQINNEDHLICDSEDPLQTSACKFYCRTKYFFDDDDNICTRINKKPVCKCGASEDKPLIGTVLHSLRGHTGRINTVAALNDGNLATGSSDTTIRIWNANTGASIKVLRGHESSVHALVALSGGELASGSDDSTIKIWNFQTGETKLTIKAHESTVNTLIVLSNGYLASGSSDKTVKIWDPETGQLIAKLENDSPVLSLAELSPSVLAAGGDNGQISLWSLYESKLISILAYHVDSVNAMVVLPNGDLVSGSSDGRIIVCKWNVYGSSRIIHVSDHRILSLSLLKNGKVASGDTDNRIRIWDTDLDLLLHELAGHESWVTSLAVLKNGNLASGSVDKLAKTWVAE